MLSVALVVLVAQAPQLNELPAEALVVDPAFPPSASAPPVKDDLFELAELAPYFAQGPLAQAKQAYDSGDDERARALLEGATPSVAVRYLKGLVALRLRDWAFAASEFEALADVYPAMRDRCLVQAGWAYESLRDWASAARCFSAVPGSSRLALDGALGVARAKRWLRDGVGAKAALQPYVDKPAPPWGRNQGAEALLAMAELKTALGDEKGARTALLAAWARHPVAPDADKVLERLGGVSDGGISTEFIVTRADALVEAHQNAEGLALLEPLLPQLTVPDPLACRAHGVAGKAERKLRHHARAVQLLTPVVRRCKDSEVKVKALFVLSLSQSFVTPALALESYRALAKQFAAHAVADDALFAAAELHLKQGQPHQAKARLVELVDAYPMGDFVGEALFKLFWVAFESEQWAEAAVFLDELEGRFATADEQYEVDRARYWRGRLLDRQGQGEAALEQYESLARAHPAGYYGLLARERVEVANPVRGASLRASVVATAAEPLWPRRAGPLRDDPHFLAAVELTRLGFGELVTSEVLAIDRQALPPESLQLLVALLSAAGQERSAHGMARLWLRKELSGAIEPNVRALWEVAYPKAFRDVVVTHAQAANGLDPDLLQALMREESALDPRVRSWAGALGLCQLMPATAAGVARQLKLPWPSSAALLEPDLNIRLGARYLADLLARQKGNRPYALASYNAGESAVARWRRESNGAALDAWVEQIPLQETRGYVKRVLRSYNTYKLLYAPTEAATTMASGVSGTAATP